MAAHPQLNVRVDEVFLARLDDWRRAQADLPGRAEAVRRLVELALGQPAAKAKKTQGKLRSKRSLSRNSH